MKIREEIVIKSIRKNGALMQQVVCMEELSELTQAISKLIRGSNKLDNLTEEMADVYICLSTLANIYDIPDCDIQRYISMKQRGLEKILEEQE